MMRKYILLLLPLLYISSAFAQDLTKEELENLPNDTVSINKLFQLQITNKPSTALIYAKKALEIAEKLENNYYINKSLYHTGNNYIKAGEYELALKTLTKAQLSIENNSHDNKNGLYSKILNRIAWTFYLTSNYETAIMYAQKSIDLGDDGIKAKAYNTIAAVYNKQTNFIKAIEYYLFAEKLYTKSNNRTGLASVYNNLATVYGIQNDIEEAINYFHKSLQLYKQEDSEKYLTVGTYNNIGVMYFKQNNFDSAYSYYDKGLSIAREIDYKKGIAITLHSLATLSIEEKKFKEAENYIKEAGEIFLKLDNKHYIVAYYFTLSKLYIHQSKTERSLHCLFLAHSIAKQYGHNEQSVATLCEIASTYADLNDYKKAYLYHQEYSELRDSVFNINKSQLIEELKISFETEKNIQEIETLNTEKNYQSIIIKDQKKLLLILIFGMMIVIGFTVFITRQLVFRNKAYIQLVRKNEELLNIDEELAVQAKAKTNYIRNRISDEKKLEILKDIEIIMQTEKPFLNSDFSLDLLSKQLNTNRSYLSRVINEAFDINFSNFVNEYRIKEACRFISNKRHELETLQSIAEDVGFNSPSAFNNAFKKFTGVTPSFYIKEISNKAVRKK